MAYKLVFTKTGGKDYKKLDAVAKKYIQKKLRHLEGLDDPLSVSKRLNNNYDADYRYRAGNFRVLFNVSDSQIIIVRIDKRSDIYRMFLI